VNGQLHAPNEMPTACGVPKWSPIQAHNNLICLPGAEASNTTSNPIDILIIIII
jgi:hypothetical protein